MFAEQRDQAQDDLVGLRGPAGFLGLAEAFDRDLDEAEGVAVLLGAVEHRGERGLEPAAGERAGERVAVLLADDEFFELAGGERLARGCGAGLEHALLGHVDDGFGVFVVAGVEAEQVAHLFGGFADPLEQVLAVVALDPEPLVGPAVEPAGGFGGVVLAEDIAGDVAERDRADDLAGVVGRRGGAFVVADRDDDLVGQPPALGDHRADLGVLDFKDFDLVADELAVVAAGPFDLGEVIVLEDEVHRDHADVLEQPGEEGFVRGLRMPGGLARELGPDGREQPPPPIGGVVEPGLAVGFEGADEAEAQHEALDRGEAEHHEGFADGGAAFAEAVEAGVDGAEDLGGDRLVVLDDRGELVHRDLGVRGEFDDLERHRRERRERGAVEDVFEQLCLHGLPVSA